VELIEDSLSGLLVPPGNPTVLAEAIERLLLNPSFAALLGAGARKVAAERFSREAMIRRHENFYCNLIADQPRAQRSSTQESHVG